MDETIFRGLKMLLSLMNELISVRDFLRPLQLKLTRRGDAEDGGPAGGPAAKEEEKISKD